ncbi:hypothetical protein A2671_00315, partial [Candidatus Kaiserbacteria bacterium RIFCSPHIGHO2_01_FULL_49_13]
MEYYLYILQSSIGSYYVGTTDSIEKRINQHNNGRVKSTKPHRPWKLIYKESYSTLSKARIRELKIKGWKSRKAIER